MKWRSAAARRIKEFAGKETVEAAVVEIAHRLTEGQVLPPTNLDAILPRLSIRRCYVDESLLTAGELRRVLDGFEIAICKTDAGQRRRFTIAHEMAHALFERTGPYCPRRGRELEKLCDMVAAQILMPDHSLRRAVSRTPSLSELKRLSTEYETSLTSMAIRCCKLFGFIAVQTELSEVVWWSCPPGLGLVRPKVQMQKLAALSGGRSHGELQCSIEIRRSTLPKIMSWTTTGVAERRLFVFSDPAS